MEVILYNSTVCRLCGEENDNGTLLYTSEENNETLCELINTYLPIKVSDDGQLPRTICPGCTIQLEATVEFMNLIINGQKVIRELYQREKEYKRPNPSSSEPEIITEKIIYEINTSDGVYQVEHPIALQIAGVEKPKRKRGRPPKKSKTPEELVQEAEVKAYDEKIKIENNDSDEPTGKRRRKTPRRFKEVVQGKELERIFREEGVIEGEESDHEKKIDIEEQPTIPVSKEPEVIGHMENSGELVVIVKGKGRGRPKGRMRQTREECMICGMLFSNIGRYMSHVAQHGPVLYQCKQCEETFSTRLNFCEHQTESGHVGQNILQSGDMKNKKNEIKDKKEECTVIETTTESTDSSDLPSINKLIDSVQPSSLSEKITDIDAEPVKTEIKDETKSQEILCQENSNISKEVAESNDSTPQPLASDIDKQEPEGKKIKCNQCDKTFNSRQSKSLHIKAVHQGERPYKCGECGAAFGYPRSLSLHAISHRRHKTSAKGYACDLCGKVLNHPSSVVYHKQAEHAGQRYVCGTCGKFFRHKQLLQRHQLVHTQVRPFTCRTCNATFKSRANMLNHQLLHSGVKKFACEICKQKFSHKTSLTLHMRWHTGIKPYSCKMCGKSFTQKGNLAEHERIHTGEKPYTCHACPRRFTTSSQRRLHLNRHAEEPPHAPYGCSHCGKRFATRASWAAHVRREAGARPRCAVCARTFSDRSALLRHVRAHRHAAAAPTPTTAPTPTPGTHQLSEDLPQHKAQKQVSLLVVDNQQSVDSSELSQESGDTEERIIYITYDVDDPETAFHILEPEQTVTLEDKKDCELYSGASLLVSESELEHFELEQLESEPLEQEQLEQLDHEQLTDSLMVKTEEHLPVTDEQGNPLHFTMQDGTQLAITSVDGKSLQVVTQDGQTIPVEINGFTDEEDVENSDMIVHHLNLQKSVDSNGASASTHYYTLV